MDKATYLSAVLVVVLLAMSVTLSTIEQQQPPPRTDGQITTTASTQIVNFTELFEQKFVSRLGAPPPVRVVYQSPTTVILVGHAKILNTKIALVNNQQLWQAVDIVKEQGFTVDSVVTSGLSTINNPLVYHIILSHNKT
ncbi:MAG TPA: hypothetical protein VJ729_05935 [Nitrososphaeraceae archaeon]|jgi:hypothetical protein|nr:hypothetical protein [Nitrososphaeraceae archaeon]